MISKLREQDADTLTAQGPAFDLDKVLETALGILRAMIGRAGMQYPDAEPQLFGNIHDPELRPFDEAGYAEIASDLRRAKRESYDVTDYNYVVEFGPFAVDLYLLGFEALRGPIMNCVTSFDLPWEELDPTPVMVLMMRNGMADALEGSHQVFIEKTLELHRRTGITWESWDTRNGENVEETLSIVVYFPHERFGAGHDQLRICRYLGDEPKGKGGKA